MSTNASISSLRQALNRLAIRTGLMPGLKWLGRRHWLFKLLIPLALIAAVAGVVLWIEDGIERVGYERQRLARVDDVLTSDIPANGSAFCRGAFGFTRDYQSCWAQERRGYEQFSRAWLQGRRISTLRDQMIACFNTAQQPQGMSWAVAAGCTEADAPPPPIVRDPG